MLEEGLNSVMIYEIKGQYPTDPGPKNYRSLLSPNGQYFYWNRKKFVNLEIGDDIFVVNKTGKQVLLAKLESKDISVEYHDGEDKTTFHDLDQVYEVDGKWDPFVRLKIVQAITTTPDWIWKTLGSSENTYLLGEHMKANSAENNVIRASQLLRLPNLTAVGRDLLNRCISGLQNLVTGVQMPSHVTLADPLADPGVTSDLFDVLKYYADEKVIFHSTERGVAYSITEYEPGNFQVDRLDANEPVRISPKTYESKIKSLAEHGGALPFDGFASPVALKNALLQSRSLALTPDRRTVVQVATPHERLKIFCEILENLRVLSTPNGPKLYKPAMLACVIDAIDQGKLTENKITFDFITPRFIEKMKRLGVDVTEENAAQPFYHLMGDLIWFHAVHDVGNRMQDGREGPVAARAKVKYALLKDTFWVLLQDKDHRKTVMDTIMDKWFQDEMLPTIWIEKSHVANRPDRRIGEHSMGSALWSPQLDAGNRDIYAAMREVKAGDIVLHLIDNRQIVGASIAASPADDTFQGIQGTAWEGPAYRIQLRDYMPLIHPLHREEFFNDPQYRTRLTEIRKSHNGLFYNRDLDLNQGSYLTEVPHVLAAVFNSIHMKLAGEPIPHLPSTLIYNLVIPDTEVKGRIDHDFIAETSRAVCRAGLIFPEITLRRFVSSLLTKPFLVLTGLSGSGKTKLAQAFAQWITPNAIDGVPNSCIALIPVGADWMGNESIIGYPDGLDPKAYVTTPALELILHAGKDDQKNIPHFLILDEMNLSHVERYFADFLSAIESGEDIPLYQGPERMTGATVIPNILSLPKNLFVIGTVNVDETTYMFSPKVLDRANVIEFRMNKSDLQQFLSKPTKPDLKQLAGEGVGFGAVFVHEVADTEKSVPPEVKSKFDNEIERIFEVLIKEGAEFGYRTAYEAGRFLYFYNELRDKEQGEELGQWFDSAFDAVIVQKFLPKLHGSSNKLSGLLHELLQICQSASSDDLQIGKEARFPISAPKLHE